MTTTRVCKKCKQEKPLDELVSDKSCLYGRRPYCKECSSIDFAEYRKVNRAVIVNDNRQQLAMNDRSRTTATHHKQPWSNDEDELIRTFWADTGVLDIAEELGRTYMAVRKRAAYLGCKRSTRLAYRTES